MARRSILQIVVTSNGERTGTLEPSEFMKHSGAPSGTFLSAAIEQFNADKARRGEPERVHNELVKRRK